MCSNIKKRVFYVEFFNKFFIEKVGREKIKNIKNLWFKCRKNGYFTERKRSFEKFKV